MLDKSTVVETAKKYADAVTKEFSPISIVLFGSYANGNPHNDSDIDVGVVFDGLKEDRKKANLRLWHIAYDISLDIEPHLLDLAEDRSGFANYVAKTGQVVYKYN